MKNTTLISILVIAAVALGNAGSTLYLPGLVEIGAELDTTASVMKLTLSCYLVGFGISQLFYGPLSDAFGRRICLLTGLWIFLFGSLICMIAPNIKMLLLGRFVEGAGIGAANAVGYALMRDIYSGDKLTKQLSYLSVFVGMTPIIAPLFGGYIIEFFSWEACFTVLAIISFLLVLAKIVFLPETNLKLNPKAHHPSVALKNYLFLLRSPLFLRFMVVASLGFSNLMVINAMMPFIFENQLKVLPSAYGWLTICTGGGYFIGAFVGGMIASRIGIIKVIFIGIAIDIAILLLGIFIGLQSLTILTVLLSLAIAMFGIGLIIPLGCSGAMAPFPEMAGSEAALLGAGLFFLASILTAIASHLHENTQQPLLILALVISCITLFFMVLIKKPREIP